MVGNLSCDSGVVQQMIDADASGGLLEVKADQVGSDRACNIGVGSLKNGRLC